MTEQHLEALAKANHERLAWACLRADLGAGVATVADAIEAPCAQGRLLWKVFGAQRGWGPHRTARAFNEIGLRNQLIRVGDLTPRQRGVIRELYKKAIASAEEAYNKATAPAREARNKATAPAREAYNKATEEAEADE